MLNINLFGGPGTGKSTVAAGLFYALKIKKFKCELIQEYAKDLTYEENNIGLSNQISILGVQHHKHHVLENKVDYAITDSPFIMGISYMDKDMPIKEYTDFVIALFKTYDNLNVFLSRDNIEYENYGRNQSFEEAKEKDDEIKALLKDNNIEFLEIDSLEAIDKILEIIEKRTANE